MSAYAKVMLAMTGLAVVLAGAVALLRDTDATALLTYVVTVEALADVAAVVYLGSVFRSVRGFRLWLLLLLFTTALMNTVGCVAIGYVVARRFIGLPPLDGGLGLLIVGMGLVVSAAAPITKALVIALWRRSGDGEGTAA